jgi:2-C-methyl-D-erythritol 4-phosphate cytidylyltransferase
MNYSVVIVAAGSGTRMNLGYNKVYARLEDGRTVLEHTMQCFLDDPECAQVIVVTDADDFCASIHYDYWPGKILIAHGGSTRQESVYSGVKAAREDVVMIHDGARPFVSRDALERLKQAMETEDACLLTVPCKDTIKKVRDGYVELTYDRSTLAAAQTPQVFRTELILGCFRKALQEGFTGTDDCSLAERYSDVRIKAVEGSYENIKITTPEDLR